MIKILSYFAAFLLVVVYILSSLYVERGHKITALETQKNALSGNVKYLEAEIEKRNEKALYADKRVCEVEKAAAAEKDKGGFDWDSPLPADSVTLRLRAD